MNRNSRQRRNAVSLMELLVTMSVMSVVLTTGVGLLHRTMREQKETRKRWEVHHVAERLTTAFRRDIRQARACTVDSDGDEVQLSLSSNVGSSVDYVVTPNRWIRQEKRDGDVLRSDEYLVGSGFRFRVAFLPGTNQVSMQIEERISPHLAPEIDLDIEYRSICHIASQLGSDWRFLQDDLGSTK